MLDFRTRFFRRSRVELLTRRRGLIAEAEQLGRAQVQLAHRAALVRAELIALRERLWPRGPGRAWSWQRRPRIGGPPPIPRPPRNAVPLSGRQLRYAALGVLVRAQRPLALWEVHAALHVAGYRLAGRRPVQQLADALGYEHEQGRARRVMRSVYTVGTISPSRRRRATRAARGHAA